MTHTIPNLCGSVAGKASPLGVKLHNAGYDAIGLDYRYIAIGTDDLANTMRAVRTMGFRGVGVSMPFKAAIIEFLDDVSPEVSAIGACNTVVNEDGRLAGYNTDWRGALAALDEKVSESLGSAVIVGAGGVARAIAYGLKQRHYQVFVAARCTQDRERLVHDLNLEGHGDVDEQGRFGAGLIVNATPIADSTDSPVAIEKHEKAKALLDVVFGSKETPLIQRATDAGLIPVAGWRMLLHQALAQFKLYTEHDAPISSMEPVLAAALD